MRGPLADTRLKRGLLALAVTVATAVNEGDVSPLLRNLAQVLLQALGGLLKYL